MTRVQLIMRGLTAPLCLRPGLCQDESWVGLLGIQLDFRIQIHLFFLESNKNGVEIHFECDFSLFRIQTLTFSHPCWKKNCSTERDVNLFNLLDHSKLWCTLTRECRLFNLLHTLAMQVMSINRKQKTLLFCWESGALLSRKPLKTWWSHLTGWVCFVL